MSTIELEVEMAEYRVILVEPCSRRILVVDSTDGHHLPTVSIPQWTRPAEQLQTAIRSQWNVSAILLEFMPSSDGSPCCAVAELLGSPKCTELRWSSFVELSSSALSESQRARLSSVLEGSRDSLNPFSQIGWIDEAIAWCEAKTSRSLAGRDGIYQHNAGGAFALVRFRMEDGWDYWLKATGVPNVHEHSITRYLSNVCGDFLPALIDTRAEWNAWLMSGEAIGIAVLPTDPYELLPIMEDAVESLARLQMKTSEQGLDLLEAGAFDQGLDIFQRNSEELFDYLEEAMSLQVSKRAPRLERLRLRELRKMLDEVCDRMSALDIPETIVHGDLNPGNIVTGSGHCQFIDWAEAYVGNPLITLHHLLMLNKVENLKARHFLNFVLKERYRNIWTAMCNPSSLDEGFRYMEFLAAASALYGRGDWLTTAARNDPGRQAYCRTLARHMDRAAKHPAFLEALCQ
jgi:hypothetical protein